MNYAVCKPVFLADKMIGCEVVSSHEKSGEALAVAAADDNQFVGVWHHGKIGNFRKPGTEPGWVVPVVEAQNASEECKACAESSFVCANCYESAMFGEDGPNF